MNNAKSTFLSIIALVVATAALVMCIMCCTNKQTVEETLNEKPEIIFDAMKNYEKKMMEEQANKAKKAIMDNMAEINSPDAGVIANPNGTIVLVEFFDYSCGFCHKLAPVLKSIGDKNPNVKIIARELTFLGPISQYAAKATLAAKEQGKYVDLYTALMNNQGPLSETRIDELAVLAGINLEKYKADMNSDKVAQQLRKTNELAGKIQVRGVPTLILNGEVLQTIDEAVIQEAINKASKK